MITHKLDSDSSSDNEMTTSDGSESPMQIQNLPENELTQVISIK